MSASKTTHPTFAKLSTEFYKAFERRTHHESDQDGGRDVAYYTLADGSPEWMTNAIHAAHDALVGGRGPDDWVYDACHSILSTLDDYGCVDADVARENLHQIADNQVDVYNTVCYAWLASHVDNAELCDEACRELGTGEDAGMAERIDIGQYHALTLIGEALIGAIESELRDRDSDENA